MVAEAAFSRKRPMAACAGESGQRRASNLAMARTRRHEARHGPPFCPKNLHKTVIWIRYFNVRLR
jgi:hypothetical protein